MPVSKFCINFRRNNEKEKKHLRHIILTAFVQSEIQYPLNGNAVRPCGIAILSEYSKPSSIIAASNSLNSEIILIFMPELSTIPKIGMPTAHSNTKCDYVPSKISGLLKWTSRRMYGLYLGPPIGKPACLGYVNVLAPIAHKEITLEQTFASSGISSQLPSYSGISTSTPVSQWNTSIWWTIDGLVMIGSNCTIAISVKYRTQWLRRLIYEPEQCDAFFWQNRPISEFGTSRSCPWLELLFYSV